MCAMIFFYIVGTHELANIPPIKATVEIAERYVRGLDRPAPDVYPVIKPCGAQSEPAPAKNPYCHDPDCEPSVNDNILNGNRWVDPISS